MPASVRDSTSCSASGTRAGTGSGTGTGCGTGTGSETRLGARASATSSCSNSPASFNWCTTGGSRLGCSDSRSGAIALALAHAGLYGTGNDFAEWRVRVTVGHLTRSRRCALHRHWQARLFRNLTGNPDSSSAHETRSSWSKLDSEARRMPSTTGSIRVLPTCHWHWQCQCPRVTGSGAARQ